VPLACWDTFSVEHGLYLTFDGGSPKSGYLLVSARIAQHRLHGVMCNL
jgi:hypothetical protein